MHHEGRYIKHTQACTRRTHPRAYQDLLNVQRCSTIYKGGTSDVAATHINYNMQKSDPQTSRLQFVLSHENLAIIFRRHRIKWSLDTTYNIHQLISNIYLPSYPWLNPWKLCSRKWFGAHVHVSDIHKCILTKRSLH